MTNLDQLRPFLLEYIEDLEELEILARLAERTVDGSTHAEIVAATRFPAAATLQALERLVARGLVSCTALEPALYRLDPTSERIRHALALVIGEYRLNPLAVMKVMTSTSIERVRLAALRTFADCFRIGRPK